MVSTFSKAKALRCQRWRQLNLDSCRAGHLELSRFTRGGPLQQRCLFMCQLNSVLAEGMSLSTHLLCSLSFLYSSMALRSLVCAEMLWRNCSLSDATDWFIIVTSASCSLGLCLSKNVAALRTDISVFMGHNSEHCDKLHRSSWLIVVWLSGCHGSLVLIWCLLCSLLVVICLQLQCLFTFTRHSSCKTHPQFWMESCVVFF